MALGLSYKYQIFFMQIDLHTKSYATCQVMSAHDGDWFGHAAQEHVSAVQQMLERGTSSFLDFMHVGFRVS